MPRSSKLVVFDELRFGKEQDIGNLKHLVGVVMIDLPSDWDNSPTPPLMFTRESNRPKSGSNVGFGWFSSKESNVPEIWNELLRRWGFYILPNFCSLISEKLGSHSCPSEICAEKICWITQFAHRPHARSISVNGSRQSLKPRLGYFTYLSPNFTEDKICRNLVNDRQLSQVLFDFGQMWHRVWLHDIWCTRNIQGQASKVKATAWKRRFIAKLLLSFSKSSLLNLMAMSEFWL